MSGGGSRTILAEDGSVSSAASAGAEMPATVLVQKLNDQMQISDVYLLWPRHSRPLPQRTQKYVQLTEGVTFEDDDDLSRMVHIKAVDKEVLGGAEAPKFWSNTYYNTYSFVYSSTVHYCDRQHE